MIHDPSTVDLSAALRMQLRGLRTDAPPPHDLWPDIAARIAVTPQSAADPAAPRRRGARSWPALATAAALALAVGLGWQLRPSAPVIEPPPAIATSDTAPLVREAEAMTREYRGALRELAALGPAAAESAVLVQLDASAEAVREALVQDPDARFLLQRLQRVYAQRLSLTRQLARA